MIQLTGLARAPRSLVLALSALVCTVTFGCGSAQTGSAKAAADVPVAELTDDGRALYTLGMQLAANLKMFELSDAELATLLRGFQDARKGDGELTVREQTENLQRFQQARFKRTMDAEKLLSEQFVEQAAAQAGVERTPSGLVIKTTQEGSGAVPEASSKVKVHYHGTLRDGKVFDSSVERGEPAEFPLDRVIPCWTEALQKMKVGGKAEIVCPAEIAYGERGAPPAILPGAALKFEVELLEVASNAAPTPP